MAKIKIIGLPKMKKGGKWSPDQGVQINSYTPQGTSVGTQTYQDWEHRPTNATPYISDRDRQIAALRTQQENTPAIGAKPSWQQRLHAAANEAGEYLPGAYSAISQGVVYPFHAIANLSQPSKYFEGRQGYNAFPGVGEMVADVESLLPIAKGIREVVRTPYIVNPTAKGNIFNPWNKENYYRTGKGRKFVEDVVETGKIRAYNENSYINQQKAGKVNGIRDAETGKISLKAKDFPEMDTYFAKGTPLDGRYGKQYYGDHVIEVSNEVPFVKAVNQRTKQTGFWDNPDAEYNSTHRTGEYVKPRQSYAYDAEGKIKPSTGTPLQYDPDKVKLYEPHWWKGYKEVKQYGGVIQETDKDTTMRYGDDNKKRVQILGIPKYDTGGQWTSQRGSSRQGYALYTPWPISAYQQTEEGNEYSARNILPKVPRNQADAVLENDEIVLSPNDDGTISAPKASSDSHASGNDHPTILKSGSFVISDTSGLKEKDPYIQQKFNKPIKKSGYTFSELGKVPAKMVNEALKAMRDPNTAPMDRKTHKMNYNNGLPMLYLSASRQEQLKRIKGIPASPQQSTMWSGGNVDGSKRNYDDYQDAGDSRQVTNREYMKPNTTSGKKRIQVVGTPNVQAPTPLAPYPNPAVPNIPGITPTPGNMQQGLNEPTLGNVPITGTDPNPTPDMSYRPMPVDMSTMGEFVPKIPRGTNKFNKMLAGAKDAMGNYRGLSADAMGDIALGLKALNTRKYNPWEAPVQVTYPELYLESDQPVRNALSEISNTIQQGMYSGDPKAGRSAANAGQGQLLAQAAQAVGQISNRNAVRATDYSNAISGINNEKLAQQRERDNRLYQGSVIAAQQQQNSWNNLLDENTARAVNKEERETTIHNQNISSPYFVADRRGRLYLKPGVTDAQIEKMIQERGGGAAEMATFKDMVEKYKLQGMKDDMAEDAAFKYVTGMDKPARQQRKESKRTPAGTVTNTVTKRYGGMLAYLK